MEAILKFNLPDDSEAYTRANKADKLYSAVWDFSQELRKIDRYEDKSELEQKLIERIRQLLCDTLIENGIDLDGEWS